MNSNDTPILKKLDAEHVEIQYGSDIHRMPRKMVAVTQVGKTHYISIDWQNSEIPHKLYIARRALWVVSACLLISSLLHLIR